MTEFTDDDASRLDSLLAKQKSKQWMTQFEFDQIKSFTSKMYHNHCVNPSCTGYVAAFDHETHCPLCEERLHKHDPNKYKQS